MVKLDWAAAYKQIRVQSADIRQQFFYWAGRYFAELCLIFGGGSSVGIYDRVAKRVKYAATKLSYMPPEQVQQIIDDVCAAGTKEEVTRFYRKYREIAKDCNIQLASESDKDKAFEACQEGVVFGVVYNTATFTCWLREDKLSRLMEMLDQITDNPDQTIHYMKRVAGKVVAYKMLVPHGKFYMGQLIRMAGLYDPEKESMNKVIRVSDWARSEAYFWRVMLPFCGKRIILPNPDFHLPPSAIHAYTDAAGGSTTTIGMGCGAVMGSWWAYLPWGTVINGGSKYRDGKMFKHKMSAWELVGPLVVVSAGADLLRNKSVVIPVDNIGSVAVFKKGWCSSCMLATTVSLAIQEVSAAINCTVEIVKIRRCIDKGTKAADAISKGQIRKFRTLVPEADTAPARIPAELVRWINNPREDRHLGERIVRELGFKTSMLGSHKMYV